MDYKKFYQAVEESCNFRKIKGKKDNCTWDCDDTLRNVKEIAKKNGLPVKKVVNFCKKHRGHCDCEVFFNMDPNEHFYLKEEWDKLFL